MVVLDGCLIDARLCILNLDIVVCIDLCTAAKCLAVSLLVFHLVQTIKPLFCNLLWAVFHVVCILWLQWNINCIFYIFQTHGCFAVCVFDKSY